MIVSTIGYEGSDVADFVGVLKFKKIDLLVDVRDVPSSRKRGFSKNILREQVEAAGIEYLHLKVLGDPKEGREAARSGNIGKFRKIFCNHIDNPIAQAALHELIKIGSHKNICLMCFERDHKCCHRTILVEYMLESCNFEVQHIGVPKGFVCQAA
jgi:uncharacterized protein (DUF488 family)